MGADLLLIAHRHEKNVRLDWPAGRQALRQMPVEEVRQALVGVYGDYVENGREARQMANDIISNFKAELNNGGRDEYVFEVRGVLLHIRGGTSWGDDPSPGFTAFSNISYFPKVLEAIGFGED